MNKDRKGDFSPGYLDKKRIYNNFFNNNTTKKEKPNNKVSPIGVGGQNQFKEAKTKNDLWKEKWKREKGDKPFRGDQKRREWYNKNLQKKVAAKLALQKNNKFVKGNKFGIGKGLKVNKLRLIQMKNDVKLKKKRVWKTGKITSLIGKSRLKYEIAKQKMLYLLYKNTVLYKTMKGYKPRRRWRTWRRRLKVKGCDRVNNILMYREVENNIMGTLVDYTGRVVVKRNSGTVGFSGSKRTSSYAANAVGYAMGKRAVEKGVQYAYIRLRRYPSGKLLSFCRGFYRSGVKCKGLQIFIKNLHKSFKKKKKRRI